MKTGREGFDRGDTRPKKKKARRILRPDQKQKSQETIPVGLPAFQRFYAGLLRSEANDFLGDKKELWETICRRLRLPTPTRPLLSLYSTQQAHFSNRAALVIEEARQALSDSIRDLKAGGNSNYQRSAIFLARNGRAHESLLSFDLSITRVEHKVSGHSILTFSKKSVPFTKNEMLHLRQGTIFSCLDRKTTHTIENIFLGVVLPQNREEMITSNSFALMIFRKIKKTNNGSWKLTPILSLLSEQRKFEACLVQIASPVPFLLPLLGIKRSAQTQTIQDQSNGQRALNSEAEGCEVLEFVDLETTFQIPRLNEMQERAATTFLKSKSDTISLVQGYVTLVVFFMIIWTPSFFNHFPLPLLLLSFHSSPPGTGKTTLLTSVICRYIIDSRKLEHNKRCLMVCAPTNKAVTVLFSRFLNTFDNDSYPCNIVLLGDEDKLLENELKTRGNFTAENSKLRENFLYTFVDAIKDEYRYVRKVLDNANFALFDRIQNVVCRLKNLLIQKISDKDAVATAESIENMLSIFSKSRNKRYPTEIINKIDLVVGMIDAWDRDSIFQEVLRTADVVFCTLGSSGSLFLKKVIGEIDDLIIDEAAAATEPEIYIPFQYLPRRLLCVGDPKQLPATITSQFAEKMGLSKSLHERLMYDCNHSHIMLDTQYRMNPALSQFPSKFFYGGRLMNGKNAFGSKTFSGPRMMGQSVYTLYQIDGKERQNRSGSIENEAEAEAVVDIVDNLRQSSRDLSSSWCASNRLRIITFYQAQVSLIKRLLYRRNLGNVLVSTVDSSQGCEADFVIISFVRSDGESGRNTVGFVADDRRLNVALTRAKYQMICVGNIERMTTLSDGKAGSVKLLAIDAFDRQCVQPFPSLNRASSRTMNCDDSQNEMIKKRKPEPLKRNCRERESGDKVSHRTTGANQVYNSNTPSSSESDCESSFVSSSSSDSDSSTSDSSESQSNAQTSTSQPPGLILVRGTPSDGKLAKSQAGATTTDENLPPNRTKKTFIESDLSISLVTGQNASLDQRKPTIRRMDAATSRSVEVIGSNDREPSILSKTETMAVFEDFTF